VSSASAIEAARAKMVEGLNKKNENAVEIHKKFALSFACIVFVLIGAPIALRYPRGGVGLTMGVSLAVFAIYYVGLIGGESLGNRGFLPPFFAMWAPNIILLLVALLMLARIGHEDGGTRGGDMSAFWQSVRSSLAGVFRVFGAPSDRRQTV